MDDAKLRLMAQTVLNGNWSHDHTVPSRTLYPHQWSWDAAFISIGLAGSEDPAQPARAFQELRSLFRGQWPDGRVPHIVFDQGVAEKDYFPGPSFWQAGPSSTPRAPAESSGIVQPPLHALAAWLAYQRHPDAEELRWLYPRLVAQQRYLANGRDIGAAGLVSIVHPWESGLDNSPAWDQALAAINADTALLRQYRRQDLEVSTAEHRPSDNDYARYLGLATAYRSGGYQDTELRQRHPFLVECPTFNAAYIAAEVALGDIAETIGDDPAPHRSRAAALTRSLVDRLFEPASGMFHALDVRTGTRSPARCIAGLIPLILPELPESIVDSLLTQAASDSFGLHDELALPLPSYDRTAADFDSLRYWRGPIWINMNWLLWHGLRIHRHPGLAEALRSVMLRTIGHAGCYEYFDPGTGAGIGTPRFSWTAALALDLLADSAVLSAAVPAK